MPMSATKDRDGSHAEWWETERGGGKPRGGEEVEIKVTEATEIVEEMEVERRNRKISSGREEEEEEEKEESQRWVCEGAQTKSSG